MIRISDRSFITGAFAAALGILLVIAAVSFRTTTQFFESVESRKLASSTIEKLATLLSLMKDAETGQRGYLITGDDAYLEPDRSATRLVPQYLKVLRELTALDTIQQASLDRIEPLIATKFAELQQTIELRKNMGFEAAQQLVRTNQGKRTMDDIRQLIGEMKSRQEDQYNQRDEETSRRARSTTLVLVAGTLVSFVLLLLVFYLLRREISARTSAEKELDRFFTLSLDILCIIGYDGYFKRLNPAWEKALGFTDEELLGKPFIDFVYSDDRESTTAEAGKLARGLDTISFENRYVCKNGSYRWFLWSAVPLPEKKLIYCTARDITDRKGNEEEMRRINKDLDATNKELEAFTYSVSHDLRAPLRHIDGFTKLLLEEEGAGLSEEGRRYLSRIAQGATHMGQLVDDLLNLARIGRKPLDVQVTGLNSLVDQVVAELKVETQARNIEWKTAGLPFVECDPALMKQVFANLLSNAVKYTRPREQTVIEVGTFAQNGHAAVFVRDNGVGFSMKYADKLFGVFQRLHRSEDFEGTGVGLATVQRIIHKHGGHIWAEAELDKGATFYFTLGGSNTIPDQAKNAR